MARSHLISLLSVLCALALTSSVALNTTVTVTTCSASEWQCADGGCIGKQGWCDAVVDCRDASDEYLDNCVGVQRPMLPLRMLCSLSAKSKQICPDICYHQPEFCFYALTAENGRSNTCRLPKYPAHGKYTVQPTKNGFRLNYTCDQSYVLQETERMECVNGTWLNEDTTRHCAESCPLHKSRNFTYACQKMDACGDRVPVSSVVTVSRTRAEGNLVSINIVCHEDKTFNLSTECVNEIDDLQQNFENPTMTNLTTYEATFSRLKAKETFEFQTLVKEFHKFEEEVQDNLAAIQRKSHECDLTVDLILYDLLVKTTNIPI